MLQHEDDILKDITLPWATLNKETHDENMKHAADCQTIIEKEEMQFSNTTPQQIQNLQYEYKGINFDEQQMSTWNQQLQTWTQALANEEEEKVTKAEQNNDDVTVEFVQKDKARQLQQDLLATFTPRPKLNVKQEICFYLLTDHIVQKVADPNKQELLAITGPPGVGKSTVLNCVRAFAAKINWSHHLQTAAFMHTAARQIHGTTIHKLGQILIPVPINPKQHNISKKKLQYLQKMWKHIDELLGYQSHRAQYAKHNTEQPFGGVTCIFFGDFYQIPDVSNNALYMRQSANKNAYAASGYAISQQLTGAILLEQIERSTC
jgi:ATPase subunit of ABC transporter with duplicated ATPase domains